MSYDNTKRPLGERAGSARGSAGSREVADPDGARLGGPLLRLAIDADEAESRLVSERPLEVVERGPVEVATHIDPLVETTTHLFQGLRHIGDAAVIVRGADPVLRHDRGNLWRHLVGPSNRGSQRLGIELVAHEREFGPLRGSHGSMGADALARVRLHPYVIVSARRL